MVQQVELGSAQGVSVPSKADFVFYPVRQPQVVKPMVLFTDGYTFHRARVGKDMALVYALALHADPAQAMPSSWQEDLAGLPREWIRD